MSVVLIVIIDGGRRLVTHCGVDIFRIFFGIQVESACLAVCSLLNTDVTDSLMLEHVVSPTILFFVMDCC